MFSFSKTKEKLVMTYYGKIKLFSGAILHGVTNEPEVYLEPSQTSMRRGSIFLKIVKGYKLLTIFTKKLHRRCLTWF